ncbi:MAG TPA: hypothetical protein VHW46_16365 [Terracidiphilus sp.]|jgi:hypothetical protein|nr:hypothetical protein [Terracidiphilus sp.]
MPAGQFVRVLHVLIEGLVLQRLLTPELIPDPVIRAPLRRWQRALVEIEEYAALCDELYCEIAWTWLTEAAGV